MSTYIIPTFIPGYEDAEPYVQVTMAAPYPDMWTEEKYAEGALWHEYKRNRELAVKRGFAFLSPEQHKWERVLARLAEENGWQVKNAYMVEMFGHRPVYAISSTPDDYSPCTPDSCHTDNEGIKIDMRQLANILGDLMPHVAKPKAKHKSLPSGFTLQDYCLMLMAAEQGWQLTIPTRYNNFKQIYRT